MARFWVEFINGGEVEKATTIDASTPIQAALKAAGGEVTFRRNQAVFIKVTPAGSETSFQFVKA